MAEPGIFNMLASSKIGFVCCDSWWPLLHHCTLPYTRHQSTTLFVEVYRTTRMLRTFAIHRGVLLFPAVGVSLIVYLVVS